MTSENTDGEGMGAITIVRRLGHLAVVAGFVVLAGCSGATDDSPAADADTSAARSVAEPAVDDTEPSVPVLSDPAVNPEGVIFAAILLETGGDVDRALADGTFTRDDLDAARDGLADGSLDYLFD